ncbi:MAG: tRNA pseudouridine(38-40) synthase TruA [Holosporaceae bacterium]|jgi:tRNA pseudouridine38-40 synthase|nr:tRNA pseudouridine(38-40) synthase TruA [Holosporaceae bacterium]
MTRYKITVEYDGSLFFGWQRQKGLDTVQQRLEEAILPLTKVSTTIYGAGRTDAGVHALAQVAHFDTENDIDCFRIQECMNAYLRKVPIAVLAVEKVSRLFDARFSALERFYIYKILNRRMKACIDTLRVWNVTPYIDDRKMNTAAQCLVGKHDFSSFRAAGCQSNSPIKTLNMISIERLEDIITVRTSARSFLYHQVRNMVGSLVFVGCGKWSEQDFYKVFQAKDRQKAAATAPAHGLYFTHVIYPRDF